MVGLRCLDHRRIASKDHTASTTANGHVPASAAYKAEAAHAAAKTRVHQVERCSKAYEISITVTAAAPNVVSRFIDSSLQLEVAHSGEANFQRERIKHRVRERHLTVEDPIQTGAG